VQAAFEDFRGRDFDVVVAAQSWHWMPEDRFARAAAAAPALAILRNETASLDRELQLPDPRHCRRYPTAGRL
jgi:hypothetical protein